MEFGLFLFCAQGTILVVLRVHYAMPRIKLGQPYQRQSLQPLKLLSSYFKVMMVIVGNDHSDKNSVLKGEKVRWIISLHYCKPQHLKEK